MKIYTFNPILKSTLWGGDRIAGFKGIDTQLSKVGESWEISALQGQESIVSDGPEKGMTLTELISKHKGELVGESVYRRFGNKFPLLVKFIDASSNLSVQVHPNDELARKRHDTNGKSEMWYVIGAEPKASVLLGFKKEMSPEEYLRRVEDNTLQEYLCRYETEPGDCFFLSAGRIHSIGAGTLLAEIQQTSDITYRIYDYNRLDSQGNPRELHTELAIDAIDFSVEADYRTHYEKGSDEEIRLVHCDHFKTNLYRLEQGAEVDLKTLDSFVAAIVCGGRVDINADGEKLRVSHGMTVLVSASAEKLSMVPVGGEAEVLLCHM